MNKLDQLYPMVLITKSRLEKLPENKNRDEHIQEMDIIIKMYESGLVNDKTRDYVTDIVEDALKDAEKFILPSE